MENLLTQLAAICRDLSFTVPTGRVYTACTHPEHVAVHQRILRRRLAAGDPMPAGTGFLPRVDEPALCWDHR